MILHVAQNATNSVVPFNVATQTVGTPIPLGSDPKKGPLTAAEIQVQPGKPNNFIATLNASFNGSDGVELIKNGHIVSQFLNEAPNDVTMAFPKFVNSTDLFGLGQSFSFFGSGLLHFVMTSQGLLEAPGISGNFGVGPFDSDGTNIYDSNGQVFSVKTGAVVGNLGNLNFSNGSVLTDTSSARSFVVDRSGNVQAFDNKTFAQVAFLSLFIGSGNVQRPQHWGTNGLSYLDFDFSTNSNDLVLLRTNLFCPAPGPNPLPTITTLAPATVVAKGPNFLLTVNGTNFTRGAVVQWNGTNRTTHWVSATKLIADIPAADIAVAGSANIKVLNPVPGGGGSAIKLLQIQ
jgi:hypothetical protein